MDPDFFGVSPLTSLHFQTRPRLLRVLSVGVLTVFSAQQDLRAQAQPHRTPQKPDHRVIKPKAPPGTSPALLELQKRMAAAQAARNSGDAEVVSRSNRLLIALAFRELAHMRLVEAALPQAIELYGRSLEFEDLADTRVDLAVAQLQAQKLEDCLVQAGAVTRSDPSNARAWNIQGQAWMMKGDYRNAADSLTRTIALHPDMEAAYSLGIALLRLHEKEKAAAVFKKMEATAIDRGTLHVLFARAYRDANYLDEAARELRVALKINPRTPHAHYLLGLVSLLQAEWAPRPESRREFLLELQLNPRDFLSNYLLGAMASTAKNFPGSNHYLQIATQIDPTWPEPWTYLGLNANIQGQTQRAEEFLRKAIALTGTDYARSNFLIRKAYFALGRILISSGRKEEGQAQLKISADLVQKVRDQSRQEMESYLPTEKNRKLAEASGDDKQAVAPSDAISVEPAGASGSSIPYRANLSPDDQKRVEVQDKRLKAVLGAAFNDLATSEAVRQKFGPALEHYQEAERWDNQLPGLMRNLGMAAANARNFAEAARALAPVLASNPKDDTVRALLGMSYYMTDQHANAANTISPLGDAVFQDAGLAYAWADSLAQQDQLDAAGKVLEGLEKQPLSEETTLLVGRLWDRVGNHARSVQTLQHLSARSPSWPKAHYYAGLAYIHANQPEQAAAEFKAELAITPDDPDAKYNLGFAHLQLSQREEAVTLFQSVIATHPDHAPAQYQLGKILSDEGKIKEAIAHLEAAARLSPQTDYIHYQLQAAYRLDARTADADRELAIYKEVKARNRGRTQQGMGEN